MKKTKTIDGVRYKLSNEVDINPGDKIFPIYLNGKYRFDNFLTGFPNKPHIAVSHQTYLNNCFGGKPKHKDNQIYTTSGYGDKEQYFKIIEAKTIENIKKEKRRKERLKQLINKSK